jgi:hypothetical protein
MCKLCDMGKETQNIAESAKIEENIIFHFLTEDKG